MLSTLFLAATSSYLLSLTKLHVAADIDYENWYCNHFKGTPTGACFGKAGGNEYKYTCLDEYTIIYEEYPNGDCSSGLGSPTSTITYTIVDPYDSSNDNDTNANYVTENHEAYCNNLNVYAGDDDDGDTSDSDEDDNGGCDYFAVNKYSASSSTTTGECDGSYETVLILNAQGYCYNNNSDFNNEYFDYASAWYDCAATMVEVRGYDQPYCSDYQGEITVDYTQLYQSEGANECYNFICSDQSYIYPELNTYSFFDDGNDYKLVDGACNNYDGMPLNTCLGDSENEQEIIITCSDTSTITYYVYENGNCDDSDTSALATNAVSTYSIPIADMDDYVTATCDASEDCKYFIRNDYSDENPTIRGFCYGNYDTDRALFMNACYKVENDDSEDGGDSGSDSNTEYSAMFSCDGSVVSGMAYASGDCSGDTISSFDSLDMAVTVVLGNSDALEECYEFNCNGVITSTKDGIDIDNIGGTGTGGDSGESDDSGNDSGDSGDSGNDSDGSGGEDSGDSGNDTGGSGSSGNSTTSDGGAEGGEDSGNDSDGSNSDNGDPGEAGGNPSSAMSRFNTNSNSLFVCVVIVSFVALFCN